MTETRSSDEIPGWVLLSPDAVPEVWRPRGVTVVLVPMTPSEAAQVLSRTPAEQSVTAAELPLVRLVAKGHSAEQIARELRVTSRTVHRHVARLRDAFGVSTLQELATELARRGF
jgi:DNA-binding CsgD family transcriptional regulator